MKKFLLTCLLFIFIGPLMAQTQERFNEEEEQPSVVEEEVKEEPAPKPPQRTSPKKKTDFWSRTRFGGNFGAGFANGQTYVNLSPRMYYAATDKWWVGTGITWIYSQNKFYPPPYNKTTVYGLNLFTTYKLFGPLFVQAEYEPLNFEQYILNSNNEILGEKRIWVHGLLLGGGISQPIGNNGAFFASVLYNVTWRSSNTSYYNSPWVFRIGFGL